MFRTVPEGKSDLRSGPYISHRILSETTHSALTASQCLSKAVTGHAMTRTAARSHSLEEMTTPDDKLPSGPSGDLGTIRLGTLSMTLCT